MEQLISDAPGQGPKRPRVLLASSASALSRAADIKAPDAGERIYLVVFWGEKPTGGYSVEIRSMRVRGDRATVRVVLKNPPPDAMLTQALTYPYAVAVVRGEDLRGKDLTILDQRGRRLDWPVRYAGPGD